MLRMHMGRLPCIELLSKFNSWLYIFDQFLVELKSWDDGNCCMESTHYASYLITDVVNTEYKDKTIGLH